MLKASRINYERSHEVKEQRLTHAEPSPPEKAEARECMKSFADFLCTTQGNHFFLGQILRYRLSQNDSLMENVYTLLNLILKTPIDFVYCAEYGVGLWPHHIGFQRVPVLEEELEQAPHCFFDDYISETTTFLVFNTDFRFPEIFGPEFRRAFYRQALRTLLVVGLDMKRLRLVQSIIRSSILMHRINEL